MGINFSEVPQSVQIFFVIASGLCIGSFLNVVIWRLPRNRSIVKPSSRCGFCRSAIPGWMNIPILSFLYNGGSCVRCGHAYSARYPIVEALTSLTFLSLWSVYHWSLALLIYCLFAAALIAMTFIDLEFKLIPDEISLGGWTVAIILAALPIASYPQNFLGAVAGSVFGSVGFWLISKIYYFVTHEEGLGGGDVKLMGFIGALLGIQGAITTIFIGAATGSIVGIASIIFYKKSRRYPIPFGPFLAAGALVNVFGLDRFWWGGL